MDYTNIFYTMIHDTNFFNNFFYSQYILDTENEIAYHIQTKEGVPLTTFLKQHDIPIKQHKITNQYIITESYVLILNEKYPQYLIVLIMNETLSFFQDTPSLIEPKHQAIQSYHNLTAILKAPVTSPVYIVFFDMVTNQNLELPSIKKFIYTTIGTIFQETNCYFKQVAYNHFYLLIKEISEPEIFIHCKHLKAAFSKDKSAYFLPRFLLVEYPHDTPLEPYIEKIKTKFLHTQFDPKLLVLKENMDAY